MNLKSNTPLVSIALATYNGEVFLQSQLQSLVSQTYQHIEIIVSDDNSTDNTIAIIENFRLQHSNIQVYVNTNKKGLNHNFENAIKNCNGDFIALCDQDDLWLPQKIELMVQNIGNAALIYHNSLFIDQNGVSLNRTIADKLKCYMGNNSKAFLLFNCVSGHACMFAKKLVPIALPIPSVRFFDWWLAFLAAENGGVKYLDQILVHYRQHQNSKTDMLAIKKTTTHKKEFIIYNQELEWYNECAKKSNAELAEFYKRWAFLYAKRKDQWLSIALFRLAQKNKKEIYYIKNKSTVSVFFETLKLLWGLKLKLLFDIKKSKQK